ncbi:MAG: regulatory protein RecX [Inhella sp.]
MGLSPAQLRARALACLALREHSRAELHRKLLRALQRAADLAQPDTRQDTLQDADATVAALLDALTEQGLLSEARYIDSRLRTRAPRLGARRLSAELAQQGLRPEGDTWAQVQATEAERAQSLLHRRFGDAPPPDPKERARRVRFLVARGFATDLALRLVEGNLP